MAHSFPEMQLKVDLDCVPIHLACFTAFSLAVFAFVAPSRVLVPLVVLHTVHGHTNKCHTHGYIQFTTELTGKELQYNQLFLQLY